MSSRATTIARSRHRGWCGSVLANPVNHGSCLRLQSSCPFFCCFHGLSYVRCFGERQVREPLLSRLVLDTTHDAVTQSFVQMVPERTCSCQPPKLCYVVGNALADPLLATIEMDDYQWFWLVMLTQRNSSYVFVLGLSGANKLWSTLYAALPMTVSNIGTFLSACTLFAAKNSSTLSRYTANDS